MNTDDTTRPGLRQVAIRAGVSLTTASNVFTATSRVSDEARAAVLAAAADLRYRHRRRGASKAGRTASSVGFLMLDTLPFAWDPVFSHLFHEVERACTRQGLSLMHAGLRADAATLVDLPPMLQRRQVDGLLVAGYVAPAFFDLVAQLDLPAVVIDHYFDGIPVDCVTGQDRYGGYLATRHLLEQGHCSPPPAMIVGAHDSLTRFYKEQRLRGYRQALAEFGVPYADEYVQWQRGPAGIAQLLSLPEPPTAVFCWHDRAAVEVLNFLHERGAPAPKACSVVGYDDSELATRSYPQLTTIHVDRTLMAHTALQLLLERMKAPELATRQVRIGVQLVERHSVAAPCRAARVGAACVR